MFKQPEEVSQDVGQRLTWMLKGIEAIDIDRKLVLSATRGNAKNGHEKWFIYPMTENGTKDYNANPVKFRAWNLHEAIEKANTDIRLINRINKLNK